MSRIANAPISIPKGVSVDDNGGMLVVKGDKGQLSFAYSSLVKLEIDDGFITIKWELSNKAAKAYAGTARASINNMVKGVSEGFIRKMQLVCVGYRAQVKESQLSLALGYSNPVEYLVPENITIEAPSQTELLIKGCDKQKVGQVAAELRSFRPPEPYKGKGIRIADEYVTRKEAKKK